MIAHYAKEYLYLLSHYILQTNAENWSKKLGRGFERFLKTKEKWRTERQASPAPFDYAYDKHLNKNDTLWKAAGLNNSERSKL